MFTINVCHCGRQFERKQEQRARSTSPLQQLERIMSSPDHAHMARKALLAFAGVVFAGWLMIWVVMPTNPWRNHWSPKLRAQTDSTYFGRQGTNVLVYTFPILLISVVGCIYLHMLKRDRRVQSGKYGHKLASWRRPAVVNWPLGVVSRIELFFLFMFLVLLVWFYSTYLRLDFPMLTRSNDDKWWQTKLKRAGWRFGYVGDLCCAFLLFPVTRGSSLLPLLGLTSEASVKYHVWLGHIALVAISAHGILYVIYWASTNTMHEMIKWTKAGIGNVPGEIALLAGWILWAMAIPRIRRKMFELFYYTHQLYIVFFLFYLLHVGIGHFSMVLGGLFLFAVDRYLRFLQSRDRVRLISARLLPSEAVELNFSKIAGLSYNPLSSVFINVPSVSSLQWHPFTVCSSSNLEPERLSIIIKKEGSWTQKLYRTLSSSLHGDRLDVSVEGPYGPPSMNFLRYESLIMISGGSGITPFISIIRELVHRKTTLNTPTPSVVLICAFKTSVDLTMLDLLIPISGNISDLSRLDLKIEAFVTREAAPAEANKMVIQNVWFKPRPSDTPIAPVLGPNGWLWLAAVVSSSFMAYLLLIGIVQRYYVYPIDHNTGMVFSTSARALLNLLFMCIFVVAAASSAVLWNKRRSSREAKQIQNVEVQTPTTSPSSWIYNADRELESLPHESLVQATKVNYGGRPDLKRMLLAYDDANIGVMASGPRGMRHEVATICSSGLADNLHFESISFNW